MTEQKKYRLIFAVKAAVVALITALHCFWIIMPFFMAVFVLGIVPAVLICLAIIVVIGELFPKARQGRGFFIRHMAQPLILTGTVFASILLCNVCFAAADGIRRINILSDMNSAEAILEYNTSTYYMSGIDGIDTVHSLIIIDYDTMEVDFLFDHITPYKEFKLEEGVNVVGNMQARAALPSPARELVSYYPDEDNLHRTCALQIIMEDGTVYGLDNMRDSAVENEKNRPECAAFLGLHINERIRPMGSEPPEEDPFRGG